MNNFLTQSQLIGMFTDKELTPEEEKRLLYKASCNPLLRNELRLDRDINKLLADYERLRLSQAIRKTIIRERYKVKMPLYVKIAASVIILFTLAGLSGLLIGYTNQNPGHALGDSRAVQKPVSGGLLGLLPGTGHLHTSATPAGRRELIPNADGDELYTPRPEYEFLVGAVTRDVSLFVISPLPRVRCKPDSEVDFSWRWMTGPVPVCLEITDNRGHIVLKNLQLPNMNYSLSTRHWARGLYYYKITAGDELVTLGSISIY